MSIINLFLLILLSLVSVNGIACEQDVFSEEDIFQNRNLSSLEILLDQAENSFIEKNYSKSIEQFSDIICLYSESFPDPIFCRALLGRSLAYAIIGDEEYALSDLRLLDESLSKFSCQDHKEEHTVYGEPILGPEQISIQECLDRVSGTESAALAIVAILPINLKLKSAIIASITTIAYKSKSCCRQGGVWKACLKPLLEKWKKLKIWENFGVPADPMWD